MEIQKTIKGAIQIVGSEVMDELCNKWYWENFIAIWKKNKSQQNSTSYSRINSLWIEDLNIFKNL